MKTKTLTCAGKTCIRRSCLKFTLIELLIVIAIIAVLAGMLLPALSRVKGKVQSISCLNQQKQVFTYCSLYTNDYGHLMYGYINGDLRRSLWGLADDYKMPKEIADCPYWVAKAKKETHTLFRQFYPAKDIWGWHDNKSRRHGYQFTNTLSQWSKWGGMGRPAAKVMDPSFKLYIYDGTHPGSTKGNESGEALTALHENYTAFPCVYLDGHGTIIPSPNDYGYLAGITEQYMTRFEFFGHPFTRAHKQGGVGRRYPKRVPMTDEVGP